MVYHLPMSTPSVYEKKIRDGATEEGGEISSSRNRQDETEWAGRIDLVARRRGFSVHVRFRFRLPLPFDRY